MAENTPGRAPLPINTETPLDNETPGVEAPPLREALATPTAPLGSYKTGVFALGTRGLHPMPYGANGYGGWGKQWGSNWVFHGLLEQLLCDSKIYQGLNLRKNAVQGRSIRSIPCVAPSHSEFEFASQMADFWSYCRRFVRGSWHQQMWQLQDAVVWGHKIAEITARIDESPAYRGKWCPDRLNVWPNFGYQFMQDDNGHFCAVRVHANGGAKERDIDPRKFAIYTFRPQNDNPYGTQLLAATCEAFYKSVQANPELIALMTQYGRPGLYVIAPELKEGMPAANIQIFDSSGNPAKNADCTDMVLSPLQYNAMVLQQYKAGTVVNLAGGSAIGLLQATPGGEALFRFLKEDTDRDKIAVILGTDQLTESKGVTSEGNAGSSETILGYGILDSRRAMEELDEAMAATFIELNYGKKGLQYLPISDIGSMANPRLVSQFNAFVGYINNGACDIDQNYWYCASNGFPLPNPKAKRLIVVKEPEGTGGNPNNTTPSNSN